MIASKDSTQNSLVLTRDNSLKTGEAPEKLEEQKEGTENLNIEALPSKELITRSYEPTKVLLFTGLPAGYSEMDILLTLNKYGKMRDIYILENKPCCYIEFETKEQAVQVYEDFTLNPVILGSKRLTALYTGRQKIIKKHENEQTPSRYIRMEFMVHFEGIDQVYVKNMLQPCEILNVIFRFEGCFIAHVEAADIYSAVLACEIFRNNTDVRVSYINEKKYCEGGFKIQLVQQARPSVTSLQDDLSPMTNGNFSPGGLQWGSMPYTNMYQLNPNTLDFTPNMWNAPRWDYKPPTTQGLQFINQTNEMIPPRISVDNLDPRFLRHTHHSLTSGPILQTQLNLFSAVKLSSYNEPPCPVVVVEQLAVPNMTEPPKYIVTPKALFRLFGCYGNVLRVKIHYSNKEKAFIEFQNEEQAKCAKDNLNDCPLWGRNMLVTLPKKPVLVDTSRLKGKEEDEFLGDFTQSREHRYIKEGSKNTKNITPPSNKLHMSNLCMGKDEEFYKTLFKDHCKIEKFSPIDETMAIVEVSSVQEAVTILILYHNYNIEGKLLKISFAKSSKRKFGTESDI